MCAGEGRLDIKKASGIKNQYVYMEERCQFCKGTGEVTYDTEKN